jgi:hypothetical protein
MEYPTVRQVGYLEANVQRSADYAASAEFVGIVRDAAQRLRLRNARQRFLALLLELILGGMPASRHQVAI